MNSKELIAALAEKTGSSKKDAENFVDAFEEVLIDTIKKSDSITLTGFGVFKPKNNPERDGRNPQTGESIRVPASKSVSFKPGKTFKDALK